MLLFCIYVSPGFGPLSFASVFMGLLSGAEGFGIAGNNTPPVHHRTLYSAFAVLFPVFNSPEFVL